MRLSIFFFVMLTVLAGIGVWSVANGADLFTTVLRLVVSAIVLQCGYFLMIVILAITSSSEARDSKTKVASEKTIKTAPPPKAKSDPN